MERCKHGYAQPCPLGGPGCLCADEMIAEMCSPDYVTPIIGIVGAEGAKFTRKMEAHARLLIRGILTSAGDQNARVVSGGCHLGGIDIWAEQEAAKLEMGAIVHRPKKLAWEGGYKQRNLLIARDCTVLHNIVVATYHSGYTSMRFPLCYHCNTTDHIKSGGCWTAKQAEKLGKRAIRHVVPVL